MVTFSVARAYPSANELFGQIPSSHGEFTVQFDTRTLRQQSMSMPSRLVSIFRLSIVKLSTPVARMPKWPPCRMEKSRRITLWQFFSAIALLPTPGCFGDEVLVAVPRLNPLPQISPGPRMANCESLRPRSGCCASDCGHSPDRPPSGLLDSAAS